MHIEIKLFPYALGEIANFLHLKLTDKTVVIKTHNLKIKQIYFIFRAINEYRKGGKERNRRIKERKWAEIASIGIMRR